MEGLENFVRLLKPTSLDQNSPFIEALLEQLDELFTTEQL